MEFFRIVVFDKFSLFRKFWCEPWYGIISSNPDILKSSKTIDIKVVISCKFLLNSLFAQLLLCCIRHHIFWEQYDVGYSVSRCKIICPSYTVSLANFFGVIFLNLYTNDILFCRHYSSSHGYTSLPWACIYAYGLQIPKT